MSAAFDWLLAAPAESLWLLDDNADQSIVARLPSAASVLSNRFEIARAARARGLTSVFSDWQMPTATTYPAVALRVGKEKRVQEHLLRSAAHWLRPQGTLWLVGGKQEGIKSIAQRALALGYSGGLKKYGNLYGGQFSVATPPPLDDYTLLHPIGSCGDLTILSKPGVYGWDKIDRGSELLIQLGRDRCVRGASLLDLGAGYGYLTVASADWPVGARTATDNNAAALECVAANARAAAIAVEVAAGDCGDTLAPGSFDLILCNPPFHSGFNHDYGLTDRFAAGAARLLHSDGRALFVVNGFVPLPARAAPYFKQVNQLGSDGAFRVFELRHPRRQ